MIVAQNLRKTYRKSFVLNNLSVSVPQGRILAVCGANGAGKTTLLKILALILKPDAGRVMINGEDALASPGRFKKLIGYVPQTNALFTELTVRENLDFWGASGGAGEAAALLGLDPVLQKKASSLSGGMQRRLNLALGLMNNPMLLVMDEPLTGVDIKTRQLILAWMATLRSRGITVIYSTHHTDEIANTADEILVLRSGEQTYRASLGAKEDRSVLDRLFAEYS